jgi:hypothetical protein
VEHWVDGGETSVGNVVLLCKRHHRAVHEEGFSVELLPCGEARFRRPDGRWLPDVPAAPPLPADPVGALRMAQREAGLEIDSQAGMPGWSGEPFDCGEALEGFLGLGGPEGRSEEVN